MKRALFTTFFFTAIFQMHSICLAQFGPLQKWGVPQEKKFNSPKGEITLLTWETCTKTEPVWNNCNPIQGIIFPDAKVPLYVDKKSHPQLNKIGKLLDIGIYQEKILLLGPGTILEYAGNQEFNEFEELDESNYGEFQFFVRTATTGDNLFLVSKRTVLQFNDGEFRPILPILPDNDYLWEVCSENANDTLIIMTPKSRNIQGVVYLTKSRSWIFHPYPETMDELSVESCEVYQGKKIIKVKMDPKKKWMELNIPTRPIFNLSR